MVAVCSNSVQLKLGAQCGITEIDEGDALYSTRLWYLSRAGNETAEVKSDWMLYCATKLVDLIMDGTNFLNIIKLS